MKEHAVAALLVLSDLQETLAAWSARPAEDAEKASLAITMRNVGLAIGCIGNALDTPGACSGERVAHALGQAAAVVGCPMVDAKFPVVDDDTLDEVIYEVWGAMSLLSRTLWPDECEDELHPDLDAAAREGYRQGAIQEVEDDIFGRVIRGDT